MIRVAQGANHAPRQQLHRTLHTAAHCTLLWAVRQRLTELPNMPAPAAWLFPLEALPEPDQLSMIAFASWPSKMLPAPEGDMPADLSWFTTVVPGQTECHRACEERSCCRAATAANIGEEGPRGAFLRSRGASQGGARRAAQA